MAVLSLSNCAIVPVTLCSVPFSSMKEEMKYEGFPLSVTIFEFEIISVPSFIPFFIVDILLCLVSRRV